MAELDVRDAKDVITGDLFYFRSHAAATYTSSGRNVEDLLKEYELTNSTTNDRILFGYTNNPEISFKYSSSETDTNYTYFRCAVYNKELLLGATGSEISIDTEGNMYANSFYQVSDATKKDIIENVEVDVNKMAEAPLVKFTYKEKDDTVHVGTIALYWKEVLPEVVNGEEGNYTVDYATLATINSISLAKVIKQQDDKIKQLELELINIKNKLK